MVRAGRDERVELGSIKIVLRCTRYLVGPDRNGLIPADHPEQFHPARLQGSLHFKAVRLAIYDRGDTKVVLH